MWLLLYGAFVLLVIAMLALLLLESKVEVKPGSALSYNNIWTGKTHAILPGTDFIIPGIHKVLEREVSLRNEAENPSNVKLVTGDGVELEVDYIVRRLQVGYPGMPALNDGSLDQARLQWCVIQATTVITYSKRRDAILTRAVAKLQEAVDKRTLNQLLPGTDLETGKVGKVDETVMEQIEREVNRALSDDLVTQEWGFWVEIDLEDLNLPKKIMDARESRSAAEIAGKAIKDKADAAGVKPEWLIVLETLGNIFGGKRGGDK